MNKISKKATYAKILHMYEQGFSCKDISQFCNLSVPVIRTYLKESGFDTRSYRRVSESNKNKVILLIKAGYSYRQIDELLHVSSYAIREIVARIGLIGFAPRYHHKIPLVTRKEEISVSELEELRNLYFTGSYGLAKCADQLNVSDDAFLWFVYHLSEKEKRVHHKLLIRNMKSLYKKNTPATAIAKMMDISPSIVKKLLSESL